MTIILTYIRWIIVPVWVVKFFLLQKILPGVGYNVNKITLLLRNIFCIEFSKFCQPLHFCYLQFSHLVSCYHLSSSFFFLFLVGFFLTLPVPVYCEADWRTLLNTTQWAAVRTHYETNYNDLDMWHVVTAIFSTDHWCRSRSGLNWTFLAKFGSLLIKFFTKTYLY
jgi:hypothetical protein